MNAQAQSERPPKIFVSAGEASGDLHGANLIYALRGIDPRVQVGGFGGPRMRAAQGEFLADLTQYAVMWLSRALTRLPTFWRFLRQAQAFLAQERPDAVVLIDFPGFHWHVARVAHALQIPVLYYGVPQLWAWAPWRSRKMRKYVTRALCKLPFEPEWFRARGIEADYVGHPYYDELLSRKLDTAFVREMQSASGPLITLLPGSRDQEVRHVLPWLLNAADRVHQRSPTVRFAIASYNEDQAHRAREQVQRRKANHPVYVGRTPELIEAARCCIACSGSVSLELLYHRKPSVIVYRIGTLGYCLQHWLRTARYISLPNLLAAESIERRAFERLTREEREGLLLPEFLSVRDCSTEVARIIEGWLASPASYEQRRHRLDALAQAQIQAGASERAAGLILSVCLTGQSHAAL